MEGTFDLIGPIEILQLLSQAGQSGAFKVPGGEVYLEKGLPVHAQYKNQSGSAGLFQILALKEGKFRYLGGERAKQSSLEGPLENYLLQAIRLMDARLDLSPFDQVELTDAQKATHLTLSPDEFALLRHLRQPISLLELTTASEMAFDTLLTTVSHLARLGLVQVVSRTPRTVRLVLEAYQGAGTVARLDSHLLRAWRSHYGPFAEVEVKMNGHAVRLPVEPKGNAGGQLLVTPEALFVHDLHVGREVLVWPAL